MAWTTIEAICGHTYREQMYGKQSGRDSRQSWLEGRDCPDCFKAKRDAQNAQVAEKAAETAKTEGLPTLTGSPKQVAWAEVIRAVKVAELRELQSKLVETPENTEKVAAARSIIESRIAKSEAKYWIDNREREYGRTWLLDQVTKATAPVTV